MWRPCSTMRPASRTTMWSAWANAASRVEHSTIVARCSAGAPGPVYSRRAATTSASVATSTAENGSSSTSSRGWACGGGQGAGQGDALALPAGDPYSQFSDLGLVTVGPTGQVIPQPGHPHRLFDAAGVAVHIGESDIGEGDVVAQGAGEDRMALR